MPIFQYAVILNPSEAEEERGDQAKLIVPITDIIAKDVSKASLLAARSIPDEFVDFLDRVEVAVRPF